jgi:DNA polymerase-3 subunit alpha
MAANMHNDYADRKNGRKPIEYLHPDAEELLAETYGLCIYQELIMRVAQKFAGYSLAEADNLRKAMGKKVRELVKKERTKFIEGCERSGYGKPLGAAWMDIIEPFADYAFNKSHAFGYGLIAYQTAYLKANYPAEYLSALLTSVKSSLEKAAVYLADCRAAGIEVLVPDVNKSMSDFRPVLVPHPTGEKRSIVFGLSAVRNVGEGLVSLIVAEREANGPFIDFYDFCDRVDLNVLNKRTIESLVKAGGFDSLGHPRKGLLLAFEAIIDVVVARRRKENEGQFELFSMQADDGAGDKPPAIPEQEFGKKERLAHEKEMLGLYVSDHPLLGAEAALRRRTDVSILDLNEVEDGLIKVCGGVITGLQRKWTRKGDLMAVFQLEDLQGSVEVMVFPKTMQEVGHKLDDDAVVVVKARVDKREDQPKLIAMEVEVFEGITDGAPPLRIRVAPHRLDEGLIDRLKGLLSDHPGEAQVFLHLGERQILRLPDQFCVDTTRGLLGELRVLLGADSLVS